MKRNSLRDVAAAALVLAAGACADSDHVKVKDADPDQPVRPPADAPRTAPSAAEELTDSIIRP